MSRLMRCAASAAVGSLAVAGMALVPAVAAGAATNLLPNGTFDGGTTSGWTASSSTLSVVSPGFGGSGSAAKVTRSKGTSYSMSAKPKPATNVAQGTQLQATGEVLGISGKYLCLLLQEAPKSGKVDQTAKQCVKATGSWQAVGPVTLTDKTAGDSVGFQVRQTGAVAGNSFQVDSLSLTSSASSTPPSSGLAAQWNMDETSGTTMVDSSGNNNNGTLHGPVQVDVPGHSGTAYSFSGKSDVDVPFSPTLVAGSANIDISFWLNTTHLPAKGKGDYDLVRMGDYPAQEYKVELVNSNQIECTYHGSSSSNESTGGAGLNNGQWHYVQCIKTATAIQVWVDGVQASSTPAVIGSVSPPTDVNLGAHGNPGTAAGYDWYQGDLDDVSINFS